MSTEQHKQEIITAFTQGQIKTLVAFMKLLPDFFKDANHEEILMILDGQIKEDGEHYYTETFTNEQNMGQPETMPDGH